MSKEKRKLAAILFADIQGYTAMMQSDESGAFQLVEKFNAEINKLVPSHNGEVIQFYGDGVLALFETTIDAISCSLALQKEFRKEPTIPVRIGLNNGEVILKEDNAFGDSINLASRIESIGIPGSVLFSENIYDLIHNKKQFDTQLIGEFKFKNVKKKLKVYGLTNDDLPVPEKSQVTGKLEEKKPIALWKIITAVAFLLTVGIYVSLKYFGNNINPIHQDWLGTWNQSVQTDDLPRKGSLTFEDLNGVLQGASTIEWGPNLAQTNRLFDIIISEDGLKINGKFQFDRLRNLDGKLYEGTFEFELMEDGRSFNGNYKEKGKTDGFYWNGTRE